MPSLGTKNGGQRKWAWGTDSTNLLTEQARGQSATMLLTRESELVTDVDGFGYNKCMEPISQQHIESRAGVCGGKPCIAGTRIRVWDIYVCHEVRGLTPDEIVAEYPRISLADVHAALAYYWDNQQAIDKQMKEADEFVDQLKAVTGPGPLERKLRGMDSESDSVSS